MTKIKDSSELKGRVVLELRDENGKLKQTVETKNLITQVGDQMYGENGAGIGSPPATPTGMRFGSSSTAAAKTGAGAAIGTYVSGSAKAFTTTTASSLSGSSRRITYVCALDPGEGTGTIRELVITNIAIADVAGAEADTIARAVLPADVPKQASDTLTATWTHDLLGA